MSQQHLTPDEERKARNREYNRVYRERHREAIRERQAIWQSGYRERNHEEVLAALREWKHNNKERVKAYQKEYRQKTKVERAIYQRAREVKITGVKIDKTQIHNWESRICPLCNLLIEGAFHIDHKIPISKGGLHEVSNLQLAHPFCNLSKKDKLLA
jgi:5-methylcytosine-specific restriction endonuclease McrA